MLGNLLFFTLVGKIFIYLWMMFPISDKLENSKFIGKLHKCDLCSGVWIYSIIFLIYRVDLLQLLGLPYIMYLGEMLSGGVISFIAHVFTLGWKSKFESFIIE